MHWPIVAKCINLISTLRVRALPFRKVYLPLQQRTGDDFPLSGPRLSAPGIPPVCGPVTACIRPGCRATGCPAWPASSTLPAMETAWLRQRREHLAWMAIPTRWIATDTCPALVAIEQRACAGEVTGESGPHCLTGAASEKLLRFFVMNRDQPPFRHKSSLEWCPGIRVAIE
jgi:hypothetical protein